MTRDLRHEEGRRRTYEGIWPPGSSLRPEVLARTGFYCIGRGDAVKCTFCRLQLHAWDPHDDPAQEHREKSANKCPFLLGMPVGNVPMSTAPRQTVHRNPQYSRETARLASYHNWPASSPMEPRLLASAGFFYTGQADIVCCFTCGGELQHWRPGDNARSEHQKWHPTCSFVLSTFRSWDSPGFDIPPVPLASYSVAIQETGSPCRKRRMMENVYPMDSQPRGICLIINNQHFLPQWRAPAGRQFPLEREGSHVDADSLKDTFTRLGFDVHIKTNASSLYILENILAEFAEQRGIHANASAFVCCLLSHGTTSKIYGVDGVPVTLADITEAFTEKLCPSLRGKPKLFFVQVCRVADLAAESDEDQKRSVLPNEPHFLAAHCSPPHNCSARDPARGTWFVQELTRVLNQEAIRLPGDTRPKEDLMSMLTTVNSRVWDLIQAHVQPEIHRQMPEVTSKLAYKIIF